MPKPFTLGVLVSGRGSNLQALLDAIDAGTLAARVGVVLSNKPEAFALTRARNKGIHTVVCEVQKGESRESYENKVVAELQKQDVDLVILAGFMRLVGETLLNAFPNRIVNIHPSLLPAFPGLHAQRQAFEAKAKVSGCTVHFVDGGCDTGPIIMQETVEVKPEDTEDTLSARILEKEHQLFPKVIDLIARGKVQVKGRKVTISPS